MLRVDDVMALSSGASGAPGVGIDLAAGLPAHWKIRHLDSRNDWHAVCTFPAMSLVAELESVAVRAAASVAAPAPVSLEERSMLCWIDLYYEQHLCANGARELIESGVLSDP